MGIIKECFFCKLKYYEDVQECIFCYTPLPEIEQKIVQVSCITQVNIPSLNHTHVPYYCLLAKDEEGYFKVIKTEQREEKKENERLTEESYTSEPIYDEPDEAPKNTKPNYPFKRCGENVQIQQYVKIGKPEMIEIGDQSKIDDFTFINGGKGIKIGRYVHISSFVSIIGGGELVVGNYVGIACGVRILTGANTYKEGARMSSALPTKQMNLILGKIEIGDDVVLGTNCVIHPNVKIGEGAVIGSNSLVLKDVEPWTINVGSPCKAIKSRPKVTREKI